MTDQDMGASDSNREQCTTDSTCLLFGRGSGGWKMRSCIFQIRFIHNLDTLSLPRLVYDNNGRVSLTQVSVGHPIISSRLFTCSVLNYQMIILYMYVGGVG